MKQKVRTIIVGLITVAFVFGLIITTSLKSFAADETPEGERVAYTFQSEDGNLIISLQDDPDKPEGVVQYDDMSKYTDEILEAMGVSREFFNQYIAFLEEKSGAGDLLALDNIRIAVKGDLDNDVMIAAEEYTFKYKLTDAMKAYEKFTIMDSSGSIMITTDGFAINEEFAGNIKFTGEIDGDYVAFTFPNYDNGGPDGPAWELALFGEKSEVTPETEPETTTEADAETNPKTGDQTQWIMFAVLLILAAGVLVVALKKRFSEK